jgi:hypothetical protein
MRSAVNIVPTFSGTIAMSVSISVGGHSRGGKRNDCGGGQCNAAPDVDTHKNTPPMGVPALYEYHRLHRPQIEKRRRVAVGRAGGGTGAVCEHGHHQARQNAQAIAKIVTRQENEGRTAIAAWRHTSGADAYGAAVHNFVEAGASSNPDEPP